MKKESANFVKKNLLQINTQKQKPAQELVQTKIGFIEIESIEYIGQEPVYNMEVEKHHNFSVNNGLIVHNCIDATRYGLEDQMRNRQIVAY